MGKLSDRLRPPASAPADRGVGVIPPTPPGVFPPVAASPLPSSPPHSGEVIARGMSEHLREILAQRFTQQAEATPRSPSRGPCTLCGGRGYQVAQRGDLSHARVCECQGTCRGCGGRGYTMEQRGSYEYMVTCRHCSGLHQRVALFNQSLVPALFADKSLMNFDGTDPRRKLAWEASIKFAAAYPQVPSGLLLVGPPGLGKTHLMCGILRELTLEKGVRCLFKDFFILLSEVKEAWATDSFEAEILKPLTEADVLVVDELGKGRNSDWELNLLDEIVCKRYNRKQLTLFTTNFPLKRDNTRRQEENQPPAPPLETLAERVSERVYSRLQEMCTPILMDGEDWRVKKVRSRPPERVVPPR